MDKEEKNTAGFVSAIYISTEKGSSRKEISCGDFKAGHGLEGDAWSGPGDRQVVILSRKRRLAVEEDIRNGLCYPKFMETLQIDGLLIETFSVGTRFQAGEAVMEISRVGKRCFKECEVVQSGAVCSLSRGAVFARVLQPGRVCRDDEVRILDVTPESA